MQPKRKLKTFARSIRILLGHEQHLQPYGIVHGGNLATLIDTATFWSAYFSTSDDSMLVSVDLKLNYLKSVRTEKLRSHGKLLRAGKSLCYAEASVFNGQNDLIAHGTSTLMVLRDSSVREERPRKFI
jgi:uncharacterized protein (TIGR00369 family)